MKVLNLLLAALFLLFAFVQINDPDPALWILIYGLMAVACVLAAFGRYYPKIISVILIIYLAYSFFYIPGVVEWLGSENKSMLFDDIAKMQYPYIEESREFLGLFICVIVLVMHLLTWRSRRSRVV
ncbi:MAG TPA: transmembrane 220 family protein [Chryseosolibacter sp.]|nr:transmembrane 220 family protein [Chryseosolibacter sp.]